jgi:zinc transport system substrate-binding protein
LKKFLAIFLVASILILSGCGTADIKKDKEKLIAVSFYPVYIFTINLTDGLEDLRVECMAEQSVGCLHDYSLTSKDARLLSDAEVFIINGAGMEGFVDGLDETVENLEIIDSSAGIEFLCESGGHSVDVEDNHSHSHSHNHAHSENSHIWMSVENAKKQVQNIKNETEA